MQIDISVFNPLNVVDSCSLWNILSSVRFYSACINGKCSFCITKYVEYECLTKRRSKISQSDELIKKNLAAKIFNGQVLCHRLTIDDLQEIEFLNNRRKLGLGELSSIAFAKRTNQCMLTDDQGARKLAGEILGNEKVQTTPHLLGWLMLNNHLSENDLDPIINDHENAQRPLAKYFREVNAETWRIRMLLNQ